MMQTEQKSGRVVLEKLMFDGGAEYRRSTGAVAVVFSLLLFWNGSSA